MGEDEMKKIKMLVTHGCWNKGIQIIDNWRAERFVKMGIAKELKDLGLHFGRSKYSYIIKKNGISEAFK